jgi:hypothetical protein
VGGWTALAPLRRSSRARIRAESASPRAQGKAPSLAAASAGSGSGGSYGDGANPTITVPNALSASPSSRFRASERNSQAAMAA